MDVTFKQSYEYLKLAGKRPSKEGVLTTTQKTGERKWSEKWSEISLSKNQIRILKFIKQNPRITRKELSNKLHINPSAVQKHIEKLKRERIIQRIGPDKGGYWKVIKKPE